jgi:hypothetical protein
MPTPEYFRRQADICLRLSLIASDDEVSSRLIVMAQDYKAKADAVEAESKSPLPAMVIHSVSPDRETNEY